MGDAPPTIRCTGLAKNFGRRVLDGIDLAVAAGEIVGYLGANGAGKTTTIRILTAQLPPSEGHAFIDGIDVMADPRAAKARLGYVPEHIHVYEHLTPREFLGVVAAIHNLPEDIAYRRQETLLEFFELSAHGDEHMASFSKGMRKKVVLTSALLHQPKALFLDEPLDGLDANAALQLREMLRELAQGGTAILYCSHVLDVVEKTCDRVAILKDGRIAAQGTMAEIRARGSLEEVFAGLTASEDPRVRARRYGQMLGGPGARSGAESPPSNTAGPGGRSGAESPPGNATGPGA